MDQLLDPVRPYVLSVLPGTCASAAANGRQNAGLGQHRTARLQDSIGAGQRRASRGGIAGVVASWWTAGMVAQWRSRRQDVCGTTLLTCPRQRGAFAQEAHAGGGGGGGESQLAGNRSQLRRPSPRLPPSTDTRRATTTQGRPTTIRRLQGAQSRNPLRDRGWGPGEMLQVSVPSAGGGWVTSDRRGNFFPGRAAGRPLATSVMARRGLSFDGGTTRHRRNSQEGLLQIPTRLEPIIVGCRCVMPCG